jgi:bacteriocin biosynthesis cyclodehydratase domain-containing protein
MSAPHMPGGAAGVPTYRLRRSLELFFAGDGDAYLLRGGTGPEHVVRAPADEDRVLLRRLAQGSVEVPAASEIAERLQPLIKAGAVLPTPNLAAISAVDAERFDRQLPYLEDFGDPAEAQRTLRASSVTILGCGGLGTWALGALACAGVGRFVLVDDDRVELSNLNRQILYGSGDVGTAKADRAGAWLAAFDASIAVEVRKQRVRGPDDLSALPGSDVLLLTADWPPYELARWVNEASLAGGFPFIMAGQQPPRVTVGPTYIPGEGACFACRERRLRRDFPLYDELAEHRRRTPPEATTLGPASALVGALLALEVLHLLLGQRPLATHDRALVIDMRSLSTTWDAIAREPGCDRCGG